MLMEKAERIALAEHGSYKISVISGMYKHSLLNLSDIPLSFFMYIGVGTRNYYQKLGYELDGPYMSKTLSIKSVPFYCIPGI